MQRVKENSLAIQRSADQELKHAGRKTKRQRNVKSRREFAGVIRCCIAKHYEFN